MDDIHKALYTVALGLVTCKHATASAALALFEQHTLTHFEHEVDGFERRTPATQLLHRGTCGSVAVAR